MCLQQSAPIELKHEKVLTKPVQVYVKAHVPAMKKVHADWSQQEIMAKGTPWLYLGSIKALLRYSKRPAHACKALLRLYPGSMHSELKA